MPLIVIVIMILKLQFDYIPLNFCCGVAMAVGNIAELSSELGELDIVGEL